MQQTQSVIARQPSSIRAAAHGRPFYYQAYGERVVDVRATRSDVINLFISDDFGGKTIPTLAGRRHNEPRRWGYGERHKGSYPGFDCATVHLLSIIVDRIPRRMTRLRRS